MVDQVVSIAHPLKIILFGSTARGDSGADSDFDLLIVMPSGANRRKTAQMIYQRIKTSGVSFDILVATTDDLDRFGDAPGLIYGRILKEGKVLHVA
ncbi:MAG TPA: nucleotidyltransferase domain-containing protein [Spirochaetota bacterium]|nr:nucleotidyltransferase domain-containing protein [Spirochaetota bacterium]HNT12428.1 nucleotidyltransferase domain-containing protein [Spirochaetota bacterium]